MIGRRTKSYCKEDISLIENYDKATNSRIGLKRSNKYKKEQSIRLKGNHKGQHWRVINGKRCWYTNELVKD